MSKLKFIRFPPLIPPSPCVFFLMSNETLWRLVQSTDIWKPAASASYECWLTAGILPDFGSKSYSQAKAFHVHTLLENGVQRREDLGK
jgi:hypothetical protein